MSLSMYEKHRGGRKGFTIAELTIATLVGAVVLGGVVMVLSLGTRMMTANTAYSEAQRGALSTVEMLSKEIPVASKVEIISDSAHDITAGIADGWHYVTLSPDSKEARHIFQDDDDRVDEKIPGSEYIEDLSFDTEVFPPDLNGGGRLLRVNVESAYGMDDVKSVDLDRTMLVHSVSGVTSESDADGNFTKASAGPILRYMPEAPLSPKLNVYGSTNTKKPVPGADIFDYDNPDTWKNIPNFNYYTELDARLELPPRLLKAVEESGGGGDVIFTWIVADPTIFKDNIVNTSAKENPGAILAFLEERVQDYLDEGVGWDLLKDKYKDAMPGVEEIKAELIEDPFNMKADDLTKGFQLMAVMEGKPVEPADENPGIFDVKTDAGTDTHKFNLGAVINALPMAYDYYRGAYMIVVAQFPDGKGGSKKWPVYVKLGNYKDPRDYVDDAARMFEARLKGDPTTRRGNMFMNALAKYGTLRAVAKNGERRYFEITGTKAGGGAAPLIMWKLTPDDFSHMIPRGTTDETKDGILYGVTNYAVYVDVLIPNSGTGGFAVVLNGSKIHVNGSPLDESDTNQKYDETAEYTTGGHYFQFDPGANGLVIRYFAYQPHTTPKYRFGQTDIFAFGTRPMYFYDATKEKFPAPRAIDFFKNAAEAEVLTENFNENAGAGTADNINYRIPFSARRRVSMSDIRGTDVGALRYLSNTPIPFSSGREGRDESNGGTYRGPLGANESSAYGVTMAGVGDFASIYSPKHMQSWHNYDYPKEDGIVDMLLPNATGDKRVGFRWDRSWHLHRYDSVEPDHMKQSIVWEQRHILKLTILEVTRDITADEVDEEWRYNIHHRNDNPLTNGQLTPLAPKYVIHQKGDMFVRAELIQLKQGATDWNNSRNYVYSKPIWYGKFKGDAWRGDDQSPFKKLGNTMQHIVADPEPEEGDDQSYRRRSMRVRSWKESFLGWDFSTVNTENYRYVWRDFVNNRSKANEYNEADPFGVEDNGQKKFPPDFYETVYAGEAGRVDSSDKTKTAHSVWTPPLEIDVSADNKLPFGSDVRKVFQSGDPDNNTAIAKDDKFGQYQKSTQYVERERRAKSGGGYEYAYNGKYETDVYGRLSLLRPWRDTLPNQTTPIFGLYAMRGWDFGTSRLPATGNMNVYDSEGNTSKRFLSVVQGLQLPFYPQKLRVWPNEEENSPRDMSPGGDVFKPERDRVIGLRFWDNAIGGYDASTTRLYDMWIAEGFSPREVRAILGLKTTDEEKIRGTYVDKKMEEADFYVPLEEGE